MCVMASSNLMLTVVTSSAWQKPTVRAQVCAVAASIGVLHVRAQSSRRRMSTRLPLSTLTARCCHASQLSGVVVKSSGAAFQLRSSTWNSA